MATMKRMLALVPLAFLTGCLDGGGEPMVSDYNGRIVKVQFHNVPLGENYRESPIYVTALETCRLDDRNDAIYQGVRPVGNYAGEHTFLCQ